jgi:hypothetical protein
MCGSDPRISEWSIADAHVPVRTYTFLDRSDRPERLDLAGRLISVSRLVHSVTATPTPRNLTSLFQTVPQAVIADAGEGA